MQPVSLRQAEKSDIPAMASLRSEQWGIQSYWETRIAGYLDGEIHPQQALPPRVSFVALEGLSIVGFIAGHLTRRYACDGELEWINVTSERQRSGIASQLLFTLAAWFTEQKALKICVDVATENTAARSFYMRNGAVDLNPHWLVWNDISTVLGKR